MRRSDVALAIHQKIMTIYHFDNDFAGGAIRQHDHGDPTQHLILTLWFAFDERRTAMRSRYACFDGKSHPAGNWTRLWRAHPTSQLCSIDNLIINNWRNLYSRLRTGQDTWHRTRKRVDLSRAAEKKIYDHLEWFMKVSRTHAASKVLNQISSN